MTLTIKSAEADRLAEELASTTGESVEEAVTKALAERLQREAKRVELARKLDALRGSIANLPVLDPRRPDEIIGYNDVGAFD